MNIWIAISSSSLLSAIITGIITYFVNKKILNQTYKNEYYKSILEKRLNAYQYIETQIAVLKFTIIDIDKKPYYSIFQNDCKKYLEYQQNIHLALSHSIWLSSSMLDNVSALNQLFFTITTEITDDINSNIEIGKIYYYQISALRENIEKCLLNDFKNLHNLDNFLNKEIKYKKIEYQIKVK